MNLIKEIFKILKNNYEILRIILLILFLSFLTFLKTNNLIFGLLIIPFALLTIILAVNDNLILFKLKSKKIIIKKVFRLSIDIILITLSWIYIYFAIISILTYFAS